MSSKVGLEKRRPDPVISECRVHRRDASEKRGLAGLHQSPWGERASGIGGQTRARDRHGFPAARTRPHHRPRPAGGSRWQRAAPGLAANFLCDFYCSAGSRNWPHRFTCRSAPDRGRAHQSWIALIIERPSSRGGASSGNRKPHRITTGNDPVVSFKTTHRNRCHPRLVAPGTLRRMHRRERDEMISSRPQT
jgi:hypothetical protein